MNKRFAQSMSEAANWVSKITTACVAMLLPGAAGLWLDNFMHSAPAFGLIGMALGMACGLYLLIQFTQPKKKNV